MKEYATYMKKR